MTNHFSHQRSPVSPATEIRRRGQPVRRRNVSEDSDRRLDASRSSSPESIAEDENIPAYVRALMRHFIDLRDRTHGGSSGRHDKEDHFARAVDLLHPVTTQVLREMNTLLLLESGRITGSGLQRTPDGSLVASWALSLARAAHGGSLTCRADGVLRDRLSPSASEGRDGTGLAAEYLHQIRCRRPASPSARHR